MSKLFKNWPVHNLLAHPFMEIVYLMSFGKAERFCNFIHDVTIPDHTPGEGRGQIMSDHVQDGERYQKRLASKKRWRDKNKAYIKAYFYWYHWTVTKPGIIQVDRPNIKDFK